jgi:hypothetical protein
VNPKLVTATLAGTRAAESAARPRAAHGWAPSRRRLDVPPGPRATARQSRVAMSYRIAALKSVCTVGTIWLMTRFQRVTSYVDT